jgi:uncharacterized damage-inducible protein DinB
MSEMDRIRDQFRRAFEGEAWHGPSVLALLDGVTAQQAAAHPIPGAHSIWELTLHAIARVDESRLNETIYVDPNIPYSSVYVTLHGVVQHDLYHAGQIAILKKAW